MEKKDTGGPAFPSTDCQTFFIEGMTLRDYFAAKAMQGLFAHKGYRDFEVDAEFFYLIADAMIKERNL